MMKRLLSIFLVLLVLVPAIASAGGVYVNEDPYYSFAYPEGWQAVDKNTVDAFINMGLAANPNDVSAAYLDMVKQMGIVMFTNPAMTEFAIVIAQEVGMDMPAEQLVALLPLMSEQIVGAADGFEIINAGEVVNVGDNSFAKTAMAVSFGSVDMTIVIYLMTAGGILFAPCYFGIESDQGIEVFESALASFSTVR